MADRVQLDDGFTELNVFATISLIAALATLLAASVEAVLGRQWVTGAITVLTPLVGGYLVVAGIHGGVGGYRFDAWLAFTMVLVGVALREAWSRGLAPTREGSARYGGPGAAHEPA